MILCVATEPTVSAGLWGNLKRLGFKRWSPGYQCRHPQERVGIASLPIPPQACCLRNSAGWGTAIRHVLQPEDGVPEKCPMMKACAKQRGTRCHVRAIALLQRSRGPGRGAGGNPGSATYFCRTGVRIYWGRSRTGTGSRGSLPGRCTSRCRPGRLRTASRGGPKGVRTRLTREGVPDGIVPWPDVSERRFYLLEVALGDSSRKAESCRIRQDAKTVTDLGA